MKRPVFDRTLSMAETAMLQVWNTKLLLPLNKDNENLESRTAQIS